MEKRQGAAIRLHFPILILRQCDFPGWEKRARWPAALSEGLFIRENGRFNMGTGAMR